MDRNLIYRKLFENIVLYNQYKNNVEYEEATKFAKYLLKLNDLIIKYRITRGEDPLKKIRFIENRVRMNKLNIDR